MVRCKFDGDNHMINHVSQIESRVYGQYRNSPKLIEWLKINGVIANEIDAAADAIRLSYDIDGNSGAQLDIIGRVVGVDRGVIGTVDLPTYEFGDTSAEFGSDEIQFAPLDVASDDELSDEYYRVLLRAKIIQNTSDVTIDSIILGIEAILPNSSPIVLLDGEDMSFGIDILGAITDVERQILSTKDIIPKPQGVQFSGFTELTNLSEFGDLTQEFGSETAQFAGAI